MELESAKEILHDSHWFGESSTELGVEQFIYRFLPTGVLQINSASIGEYEITQEDNYLWLAFPSQAHKNKLKIMELKKDTMILRKGGILLNFERIGKSNNG